MTLNIVWHSNHAQTPTGYGNQTKLFLPYLKQQGYGMAAADNYGAEGYIHVDEHGIEHLPRLTDSDKLMSNIIGMHMQHTKADIVLTFFDAFAVNTNVYGKLPWCAWAPVDSTPMTYANKDALQFARWIWAMSKHGLGEMEKAGFGAKTMYVPLATDTDAFKPMDRAEARQKLGKVWNRDLTDKFIIVMNAANKGGWGPSRKGFYEALKAFTEFSRDVEDALLYIHTDILGVFGGEEIAAIVELVGCDAKKLMFPNQYDYQMGLLHNKYLNAMYNAADVFLSTSYGEGFGIPIIEAQAAGCPVIVTDCTAMTELCLSGWLIEKGTDFMHFPGAMQRRPDVGETVTLLSAAYMQAMKPELQPVCDVYRYIARLKALAYDYRTVFDTYMKPALDRIQEDLAQDKAVAVRRAELRSKYAVHRESNAQRVDPDADAQPVGEHDPVSG